MPPVTPFFADFHRRLFGKAPLSGLQELLRHSPQVPSISHYQELFGKLVPQELLAPQERGANSRQRFFSSSVRFWSFLGQVLEPGSSCRDALRRLNAWWQWHRPDQALPSHDTSAYCQARARLSESRLRRLCDHLGQQLEEQAGEDQLWLGRRVKIIDGTSVSMPDTAANQELWPQSSAQKPGCGFPLLKLLGVFSLQSGALLDLTTDLKIGRMTSWALRHRGKVGRPDLRLEVSKFLLRKFICCQIGHAVPDWRRTIYPV